ncbi:multiple sugar transport system permease protein [Hathewaya proteolytica DSM 3090]|uniref:Multiple sugar transport system permease protein n=1 Tax=Hathewaya proteolytica DSM 3090 TaxID=1121331 RepID=A0A1M6MS22_9CLOT|nr:carbohydrate ABC transporter permease [Hathewaya proteolytica]SHJ86212.1 multiple sugar transport system permease protein [Hathewaya proteolytica DSM 3090]
MKKLFIKFIAIVIAVVFLIPILYTILYSFLDPGSGGHFSIQQYVNISMDKVEIFKTLLNSIIIVGCIIVGQLIVSCFTAYYFAFNSRKFSKCMFIVYIFIMLLPLQITLIPNVILFNSIEKMYNIKLFDNYITIILPGIFNTLGVFFLKQYFDSIPKKYIEMAKIDGASNFQIFTKVVLPNSKYAILAVCLVIFIDNWNLIEQPLIFIDSVSKMPASIYLNTLYDMDKSIFYAASIVFMFPVLFLILKNINNIKSFISQGKRGKM